MRRIGILSFSAFAVRWLSAWALSVAVLFLVGSAASAASDRVALVVGNSAYEHTDALRNPGNDAAAMASALGRLGFEVVLGTDLDLDGFYDKLGEFDAASRGADVTLFFYAGHGLQVDGKNWLAPVDARLGSKLDLKRGAVELDTVLEQMRGTKRLVYLDACRNNPLAGDLARSLGQSRSAAASRGLARVRSGSGTLIGYATAPDDVAADGEGLNSPFTEALLAHIETPGLSVNDMFGEVSEAVALATGGGQVPWSNSSLGRFYLASRDAPPPAAAEASAAGGTVVAPPADAAKAAYEAAREVGTAGAFRIVVEDFPGSTYAKLAEEWLGEREAPAGAGAAPSAVASPEEVERGLALSREDRRLIQMGLASLGHDPGPADGVFGRRTRAALRAWQGSSGLDATGHLTREQSAGLAGPGRAEAARRRDAAETEAERLRAEAEREREAREEAASRRFSELLGRPFSPDRREDSVGWTDLHYAAALDLPGLVATLCDAGMAADARLKAGTEVDGDLKRTLTALEFDWNWDIGVGVGGRTPLTVASVANARNAAAALIDCGADVNATDENSDTPLHWAASANAVEAAELLIGRGAEVHATNSFGKSPLHDAANGNAAEAAKLLIDRGADVNAKDAKGFTPLHSAASESALEAAELLIDRGADVNATINIGGTPLHTAARVGAAEVAELLIDRGADVNATMNKGQTPLHMAAFANAVEAAELLIGRGARVNATIDDGRTPLDVAIQYEANETLTVLRRHGGECAERC